MSLHRQKPHWIAIAGVIVVAMLLGIGPASVFSPVRTTGGLAVVVTVVLVVMIARHTQRV